MKLLILFAATAGLTLFCSATSTSNEPIKKPDDRQVAYPITIAVQQGKMPVTETMLIDRKKALRDRLESSMPPQEKTIRSQRAGYEARKELFDKNLINRGELDDDERVVSNARLEMERMRAWIAEDTAEAEAGDFAGRTGVAGYDGAPEWSLARVEAIERFFRARFDRALPISAMGQSETHDRLGLDHRGALDVAVRPDSHEGRELVAYLRRTGIPYIAFRGKISSVSTGAHIHIGPRSSLLAAAVRYVSKRAGRLNQDDERG